MRHLLLMTLSIATAFVLVGAVANATSIAVTNEWQMGESDPGSPVSGNNATTVVDNVGGWNMTATTATARRSRPATQRRRPPTCPPARTREARWP